MKTPNATPVFCLAIVVLAFLGARPRALGQSPPGLGIQINSGVASLSITGSVGSPCAIQFATNLSSGGAWVSLTNYTLSSNPGVVVDSSSAAFGRRFYRIVISVPANLAWVPPGAFVMGSPTNEAARGPNDETQHTVTITKGFYLAIFLVTQGAYLSLLNTNPSYYGANNGYTQDLTRPVEQVSWNDASNYCAQLTQQARAAGQIFTNWIYRLPTESEWEYACRAGSITPFYYGANLRSGMANFDGDYEYVGGFGTTNNTNGVYLERTTSVGSYQTNALGLYDMAGNVWEWCQDWYALYPTNSVLDPQGPGSGTQRVFRGGALNSPGRECRSANRNKYQPTTGFNTVGFRVVLAGQ